MLHKTEGIVVSTIPYSDTSLIAKIFTADHGLLSFMIKGARGKKTSNKAVIFQPLSVLGLDIYYQPNKNLQTIRESKLLFNPVGIYGHVHKTSVVLFMAEVLHKVIRENYHNESLYLLLKEKMIELNETPFDPDFHIRWLMEIANELGFIPFNNYSADENIFSIQEGKFVGDTRNGLQAYFMGTRDSEHLHKLLSGASFQMNNTDRRSLLTEILKYFQYHIPGMTSIQSSLVLQEVL